ncbi:hypothetical protein AB4Z27_04125 [Cupriavidus sp. KB_39]|uniref:hypothetical protein n=1 Tax=Cupriavidus sp. KB_39 TaxID=3233036 RepID=UPI003F920FFB
MLINATAHSESLRGLVMHITTMGTSLAPTKPPMSFQPATPAALPVIGSDVQFPENEKTRSRRA